eukprot:877094-Rhodomonas_salina.4
MVAPFMRSQYRTLHSMRRSKCLSTPSIRDSNVPGSAVRTLGQQPQMPAQFWLPTGHRLTAGVKLRAKSASDIVHAKPVPDIISMSG